MSDPVCPVCEKPSPDGIFIKQTDDQPGGFTYHRDCMVCSDCNCHLEQNYVTDDTGSVLLCNDCFELKNPSCRKCGESVLDTTSVVVEGLQYHADCFTCSGCNVPLASEGYYGCVPEDWLCGECHLKNAKKCAACSEIIERKAVVAGHRHYHVPCAICTTCRKSIMDKQAFLHATTGVLQCKDCYIPPAALKPLENNCCPSCGEDVGKEHVLTPEHKFHKECFKCKECDEGVTSTFHVEADGKIKCGGCYEKEVPKCDDCHGGIYGTYKKAEGNVYHVECFRCCEQDCNVQLDLRYYVTPKGRRCEDCRNKNLVICEKCGERIEGKIKDLAGISMHPNCCLCMECEDPLEEVAVLTRSPFKLTCRPCYDKVAPRCGTCDGSIIGTHTVHDGKTYHEQCFTCHNCSTIIRTEEFYQVDGKNLCESCMTASTANP